MLAQIRQRSLGKRTVGHKAVVAREPRLTNLLVEFCIGIDGSKVERPPGARVEGGGHEEWVERGSLRKKDLRVLDGALEISVHNEFGCALTVRKLHQNNLKTSFPSILHRRDAVRVI